MKPIIFILLLSISSCVNTKSISQTGIESIRFGNGGGFTGAITTYSLSAEGQLSIIKGNKNTSIKTVDKKIVKELFEKASELKSYQFNLSENVYSFLEFQTKGNTQNITWGFGSIKVDSRVTKLHNELMSLTK